MPDLLGIYLASRLSGVPAVTLRCHFDKGMILGSFRTPSGQRRISREGLVAYLQARGIEPRHPEHMTRRGSPRVRDHRNRVLLALEGPADPTRVLGRGEGTLADFNRSGIRLEDVRWEGCLPGPGMEVIFGVLGGRLKECRGRASLVWLLCRDGEFQIGLSLGLLEGEATSTRWAGVVEEGLAVTRGGLS